MKTLFKNGNVINVFTGICERADVLVEDNKVIGVGEYSDADKIKDVSGKYICPGFIDSHIHVESSMLSPAEFAKVCVPHGTTSVIADPHEIANVCGKKGIQYMLDASENIPLDVYLMLPSCVPATKYCESGAILEAEDLEEFYSHKRVLGLGEVMNFVGVIYDDENLLNKIKAAQKYNLTVNGHAPLLTGAELDKYIAAGIEDDHECTSADEAKERISKGQKIMIRQGTSARNLRAMLPLFDEPWCRHCMLVTDDKHPADLLNNGHIDDIIRSAVKAGKSAITGIQMATIQAAEHYGLKKIGAIAPGYIADILVLDDLDNISVCDVYKNGVCVSENGQMQNFTVPEINKELEKTVKNSFNLKLLTNEDFYIDCDSQKLCNVIGVIKGELLTDKKIINIDFSKNNGIDTNSDILKIAVIERHNNTGHIGLGFIQGIGLKEGAIASSVSHDSHNLIIIGTNESDMTLAGNRIREIGGGNVVVKNGEIAAEMPLPIAGLMTDVSAREIADLNEKVRKSVYTLGADKDIEPFMTMAFVGLPVIPHLKLTTNGLIDVNKYEPVPLFTEF